METDPTIPALPSRPEADPTPGTVDPTLPGEASPRSRAAGRILVGLALLIGLTALVGMQVTVPYVVISPGDATSTNDLVTVTGARTFRHRGGFYLMTVRVSSGRPNVWRFVQASLDDDTEVLGERDYYGPTPPARAQRQSVQMMDESELTATVAALTRLGYPVDFTGSGARITQVFPDSPADRGDLRRGDVVIGLDGDAIRRSDELGTAIRSRPVGTTFSVRVRRDGRERDLQVTSGAAPSGDLKGKPFFGVTSQTEDLRVDAPVEVSIDAGDVSGPSGGLAFTLTIIDDLSPGALTGGQDVAVTGTIDADGNVGEVGGVAQKAVAARDAGADFMIVPRSEVAEARARAGDMEVYGADTLDQALRILARHGGAPVREVAAAA